MNFIKAIGCALNVSHLFINFPFKKLKINCKKCQEITGNPHRDLLAQKIWRENFKLIINDVIDNNVTFQLPTGSRKCDIHMQTFSGDQFKNLRRSGKWRNVDFLKSLFTGNQLGLFMYSPKRPPRIKNIYVDKKLQKKIDDYTNNGKTYC